METKELNLYKVYAKGCNIPTYVAASTHQEAVDKAEPFYTDYDKNQLNVDWVAEVIV